MERELEEWSRLHKFYRYCDYLTNELAGHLKVSPRTIQRWVKGKKHPNEKKLDLIKKYLAKKAEEISLKQD